MKKVEAIIRPDQLRKVEEALESSGFGGFTLSDVRGHGNQGTERGSWRGDEFELHVIHKILVTVLCEDEETPLVIDALMSAARTGAVGDGIVMVSDILAVYLTRTGDRVSTQMSGKDSATAVMAASDEGEIHIGPLTILPNEYIAMLDGQRIPLTFKEFKLLVLLARTPGKIVRREVIEDEVWDSHPKGRTLHIHMARLRRRLPKGSIETVVKVGYRLVL